MIGHSLGLMGICMEEHTCAARLPHINRNVVRKQEISGFKGLSVHRVLVEIIIYRIYNVHRVLVEIII